MICPFCNSQIPLVDVVETEWSLIRPPNGICRIHRPFIVGVLNESDSGHYGYWIAAGGAQIILNIGKELTIVNKFNSVYECCGKNYAKNKYYLLYRDGWCYASAFLKERLYTINYMIDISPDNFNYILKRMERLKVFL